MANYGRLADREVWVVGPDSAAKGVDQCGRDELVDVYFAVLKEFVDRYDLELDGDRARVANRGENNGGTAVDEWRPLR